MFDNSPQLPFSDLKLVLSGGPRALFVSPQTCTSAGASSEITGWNGAVATPSSNVLSTTGGCTEGFAPAFSAGTTNKQAGAYSPFTLTIGREDGSQRLGVIDVTTPPGFSGDIAGVTICPNSDLEAAERRDRPGGGALEQADPSCPASSDVGTVTATAGAGPDSISTTGQEYLAGPYKGAPFDLVAITPAVSGPFDLGVVVLRQGLYIDPHTGQATVKSDPIPTVIDGVPLDVRSVTVHIGGVGGNNQFIFNPTSCAPLAVAGALTSTSGTEAPISSPFQAANCQSLKFNPGFAASTAEQASKAAGASLHVDLTYPSAPQGTYANIKSIKVNLPKQLPARLTTLQKACLAATFEANPASCPATSVVGSVKVITPILNSPLTGPVYLVSHGNEAFPDVVMVLQGEGITLTLVGNTQVKNGITSNTFKTIPDAPVSSVEVTLPQGPYSVLATNLPEQAHYNFCGQTLAMPTAITAQNGAVLKQSAKVTTTGCPKKKALTRGQKLAKALKACRRKHGKARSSCRKRARHTYGSHKSPALRRRSMTTTRSPHAGRRPNVGARRLRRALACVVVGALAPVALASFAPLAAAAPAVTFKATAVPIPGFPGTGNILGAGAEVETEATISGTEYGGSRLRWCCSRSTRPPAPGSTRAALPPAHRRCSRPTDLRAVRRSRASGLWAKGSASSASVTNRSGRRYRSRGSSPPATPCCSSSTAPPRHPSKSSKKPTGSTPAPRWVRRRSSNCRSSKRCPARSTHRSCPSKSRSAQHIKRERKQSRT